MRKFKNLSIFSFLVLFASCAAMRRAEVSATMDGIALGMTQEQVKTYAGSPTSVIGMKAFENGNMKIVDYTYRLDSNSRAYIHWLYFFNNRLVKMETPESKMLSSENYNWEDEMDKEYNAILYISVIQMFRIR